jgi:hypothetical protein
MAQRVFMSHREVVNVPPAFLYSVLLDKIRHPEKFVPGVKDVEIVQEFAPNAVERIMHLGDKTIHEIIGADDMTYTVTFRMHADHPVFAGFVTNSVLPHPDTTAEIFPKQPGAEEQHSCLLDFTMNWTAKREIPADKFEAMTKELTSMKPPVVKTKEAAERLWAERQKC